MNKQLATLGWGVLAALLLIMPLLCFSLRDFSRSLLEDVCRSRGNSDRFGRILRNHDRALLICELLLLMLVVLTCLIFASSPQFDRFRIPTKPELTTVVPWTARILTTTVGLSFLLIAAPWTIARIRGEAVLYRFWPLLELFGILLGPAWRVVMKLDRLAHRIAGLPEPDSTAASDLLTDELRAVVDEGYREGVLQKNATRMIHRVVDLQCEDVAAIMTPRTDMVTIPADMVLQEALPLMVEQGYSRVPVIGRSIDDVVGILYARDLLAAIVGLQSELSVRTVSSISREVLYVPESQGIETLLEKMQLQKVHMAIVVDEYSGVSGLVTLEDIVEEIVGDISDEYDEETRPMMATVDDGSTIVDARFHIDDLNRELGLELPEDDEYDTIAGFLMSVQGHIPRQGETIEVHGAVFQILEADERQLKRIQVRRTPAVAGGSRADA